MESEAEVLLTVREVANLMRCCEKSVRREIDANRLGHIRVRNNLRVPESEYRRYIARNAVKGT